MVRPLGFLVGLGFIAALVFAILTTPLKNEPNAAHEFHKHPKHLKLASDGLMPHWDQAQLQRGMQVYKEVCSACHSMNLVHYRDLAELGYTEAEVKAEAASREVPGINPETGEETTRKAVPTDHFPAPYANETAARAANNNALPPDLSLIAKSREGGAAYVYSLSNPDYSTEENLERIEAVREVFATTCGACHGENAEGNREVGAPDLTDARWVYGGDLQTIIASVHGGRQGHMPTWDEWMTDAEIRNLSLYVHDLGTGQP